MFNFAYYTLELLSNKSFPMTQEIIQKKINAIERITAEALKSKDSAKKILVSAGIIKDEKFKKSEIVKS